MSAPRTEPLVAAIDRARGELSRAVRAPEDLGASRTIALSRRLDALIYLYLVVSRAPLQKP